MICAKLKAKGGTSMNLVQLRYFTELAATQHYTRAAERLCITQPSLSHAIAQLEEELGVPLFEKRGRGTALTPFGGQFLGYARQALATLDLGVARMQRLSRGEGQIRLGLLRPLGVEFVPVLARGFLDTNPGKDIRFTFRTGVTGALLEGLRQQQYDLIFASRPPQQLGLRAAVVGRQDLVLIVPKDHPLARRKAVDLADTLPYPQIFFARGTGIRGIVDGLFEAIGAAPQIAYETDEDHVATGLAAHGFGIAVVPYMDLLLRLDVKILQIRSPAWERPFCLIDDPRVCQSPAAEAFRRYVLDKTAQQN